MLDESADSGGLAAGGTTAESVVARVAVRVRERSTGKSAPRQAPMRDGGDASLLSDAVAVDQVAPEPFEPSESPDPPAVEIKKAPVALREGWPVGGAVARGEGRRRTVVVESPLSWIMRVFGRRD